MATSVISQQQSSHSMMTQSYQSQKSVQHSYHLKTPDGDLKDVEADFQSLVNEMARDGGPTKRVVKQENRSFSSSSQYSSNSGTAPVKCLGASSMMSSSSKSSTHRLGSSRTISPSNSFDSGLVTAVPARVVPAHDYTERGGGESEVIIEKSMRVRDRVKNLEKQLSQEDLANSPVPEALMSPRYKSGSIKNLTEQFSNVHADAPAPSVNAQAFSQAKDSVELISNSEFRGVKQIASVFDKAEASSQEDVSKKLEGDFKSVRETAAKYQEPIQLLPQPVKAPPALKHDYEIQEEDLAPPVAVLPPATMRKTPSSPPPRPVAPSQASFSAFSQSSSTENTSSTKKQEQFLAEDLKSFESALTDVTKSVEGLSTDSTGSRSTSAETVVQQPLQYSAKVTCEVRSRVNTPDAVELTPYTLSSNHQTNRSVSETKITRRSRCETRTSTTTGSSTSISSSSSGRSSAQQKSLVVGGVKSSSSQAASTLTPSQPSFATSSPPSSVAAFTGKPPIFETNEPTKLSLLRSSSTGSVVSDLRESTIMTRTGSEKDLPKFNIKKIKPVAPRKFS
ncbi:hypothetical protein FHG87_013124, partial [Trinorchestia longiramus]